MFKDITENMKFFILLIVYTVMLTWWASALNTTVEHHSIITNKTVELLDAHIDECRKKEVKQAQGAFILKQIQYDVSEIQEAIHELQEDINGFKKGRD